MKWNRPTINDRRIRRGFLWFPKTCYQRFPEKGIYHDGSPYCGIGHFYQIRWLERANWYEVYVKGNPPFLSFLPTWERWSNGTWEDCVTCLGKLCTCDSREEPVKPWSREPRGIG